MKTPTKEELLELDRIHKLNMHPKSKTRKQQIIGAFKQLSDEHELIPWLENTLDKFERAIIAEQKLKHEIEKDQ